MAGLLSTIAEWTMYRKPAPTREALEAVPREAAVGAGEDGKIPVFINPKSLTFPVVVGVVKVGWSALQATPLPGMKEPWFPLICCLLIGVLITISNLKEMKLDTTNWWLGMLLGVLNSLVIFAAVMGISPGSVSGTPAAAATVAAPSH